MTDLYSNKFWPIITIALKDVHPTKEREYIKKIKKQFTKYFDIEFNDSRDVEYKEGDDLIIQVTYGVDSKHIQKMIKKASEFHEKEKKHYTYPIAHHLHLDFLNADVAFIDSKKDIIDISMFRENKSVKGIGSEMKKENRSHPYEYTWYKMNGYYYVYDNELMSLVSVTNSEYLKTKDKDQMIMHLSDINGEPFVEQKKEKYTDITVDSNVMINDNLLLHEGTTLHIFDEVALQGTFGFDGESDWVENIYYPEMTHEELLEKIVEMLNQEAEWIEEYIETDDYAGSYASLVPEGGFYNTQIPEEFEEKYIDPLIATGKYTKEDILMILWENGEIENKFISGYGNPYSDYIIFDSFKIGDYKTQFGEELTKLLNSLSPEDYKEIQGESDIYLPDDYGDRINRELGYLNTGGWIYFCIQPNQARAVIRDEIPESKIMFEKKIKKLKETNSPYELFFTKDNMASIVGIQSPRQAENQVGMWLADGKSKYNDIALFKNDPHFHNTSDDEFLVWWYGDGSYWDNVSRKHPELLDKKLVI